MKNADIGKAKLFLQLYEEKNISTYIQKNKNVFYNRDAVVYLRELQKAKGLTKAQIAKLSGQGNYVYKIFNGNKTPSRSVLICVGIGMGASIHEIQRLLEYSKFAPLDPRDKSDAIVIFGILNNMKIEQINELLYQNKEATLFH